MASFQKSANAAEIDRLALALAKEPGSKAFIPLAEEYGKAGMWQEAAAVLEDGLKAYPNFITAMVALGRTYDQLSQPVKAKAMLEEAVRLSPENLRAHRTLAKIYSAEGAKDAALRSCGVILAVNPHDQEALSVRAAMGTLERRTVAAPGPLSCSVSDAEALVSGSASDEPPCDMTGPAATLPSKMPPRAVRGLVPTPMPTEVTPASPATTAPSIRHDMRVRRLKQWLAAIQSRRRSSGPVPSV
jgi:tetratricopeptide (TPR) repeat protein